MALKWFQNGSKNGPKMGPKRGKRVNLRNFQSTGRKTLISFPTPPFFAQLDSFLARSDTSENPLPPNLVPGGAKMVPKRGIMGKFA